MEAKHNTPLIVAHRGAPKDSVKENTLKAFVQAFEDGANAIEGDFHLTLDNHIVCHHDDKLKNLRIKNSTLEQLQLLQSTLPTLQEVINIVPKDKIIYIEIKCGIEIFDKLSDAIRKSDLLFSQIVFISFNAEVIHQMKVIYPQIKTYWLYEFTKHEKPNVQHLLNTLVVCQADGLSTNINQYVDETFIQSIMNARYSYHVWADKKYKIDSIEKIKLLEDWKVESITLDVIDIVKED